MAPTNQQYKTKQALGKQPKARVQRYLKSTESQLKEGAKSTLLFKGIHCSQHMNAVLQELRALQAPHAKLLTKKNQIHAFTVEGQQCMEFLMTKNDSQLLAMATHNKKRPNNLVLGRTFDRQILDLVELHVLYFKSMHDYGGTVPKKRIGSKPLLLFCGSGWQQDLQNLLTDFYRGDVVDRLVVSGLDHLIVFTMVDNIIHQRTYFCKLKKNASSTTPLPHLTPSGPDLDFTLRRSQWAEPELYRAAREQPRKQRKKVKNQTTNVFGETIGRLHIPQQDVRHQGGRKSKALRRAEAFAKKEEQNLLEQELRREEEEMAREFKMEEESPREKVDD